MYSVAPLICLAVALTLGGCSSVTRSPGTAVPPPNTAVGTAATSTPARSSPAAVGTEPLLSAPGSTPSTPGWRKASTSSERRQADAEACYSFAWAQVDNDIRIDDDISSARGAANSQFSRITDLTQRVDSYYYEKQRISRFESCMRSKGYDSE